MKHILFVILLITCSYRVFTQDTVRVQQNELVELQSAIIRHSHKDTIRVHMLTDYANLCFYNLDFLNGFKALSEGRIISKQLRFTKGEGLYLKSISIFRRRINAGNAYIKTQNITKMNEVGEFINGLDIYYEVEGNGVLGRFTDFDIFGNINMPIGIRDSEIETISSKLEEALSYYAEKENVEITAYLQDALSFIYFKSDKEKSKKHKKIAQSLYQELKWSYHQLFILANDISDLLGQGMEAEAKPLEIEAITIYTHEADKYIKAQCAYLLSRTYGIHNRVNLQLEYLFQAEELLTEIRDKDLLKPVYISVAIVYEWYLTNSEKALEYEYKELNLRKEINFYERVANTYLLISESLFGLKRIQDFPPEYKDYLKVGGVQGSLFFDAELLWVKARMLQAQGKSEEAQSVFQESITAYLKYNDKHGSSWAAYDLAESYKSVGDLKNAFKYAHKSFDWASDVNLLPKMIHSAGLLSQLYEQSGNKSKAFFYLKIYREAKEKEERLNNAANRSELEIQAVLKKRQQEIELLETESQLKEQENKTQRVWLFSIAGALVSLVFLSFILVRNNRQKQKANLVLNSKNRELEIETALERVRSASMAMHKSDELKQVVEVLTNQFRMLNSNTVTCWIALVNVETNTMEIWNHTDMDSPKSNYTVNGKDFHTFQSDIDDIDAFKNKERFRQFSFEKEAAKRILKEQLEYELVVPEESTDYHLLQYRHNFGFIGYASWSEPDEQGHSLLQRFAKVFEQTYTRFLDLQKAEAQAREMQIELSLERIRAKAMAMHDSGELSDVLTILFEQFDVLGICPVHAHLSLVNPDGNSITFRMTGKAGHRVSTRQIVTIDSWNQLKELIEVFIKSEPGYVQTLHFPKEAVLQLWKIFDEIISTIPEEFRPLPEDFPNGMYATEGYCKFGFIGFQHYREATEEEKEIVRKFATEFGRVYQRFLDLQKAEAQAREAQIESSLERVRSKTMAMHKSQEVTGVAICLNDELRKLGFEGGGTIIIMNEENGDVEHWTGFAQNNYSKSCYVPYFKHPCNDAQLDAWKKKENFLEYTLAGKEKRTFDEFFFTKSGYKDFPEDDKKWMSALESVVFSFAFMKYGAIHWGPVTLTGEQSHTLQRFSKVFEQAYTRFLDLQKAESQAREAQIEAALERIRARSMAMHKSEELADVVSLMYVQIKNLGFTDWGCAIVLCDEEAQIMRYWYADLNMSHSPEFFNVPLTNNTMRKIWKLWKHGIPQFTIELLNKEKDEFTEYILTETDHKNLPDEVKDGWRSVENVFFSYTNTKYGLLEFTNIVPFAQENILVYQRFAKVFEQTYTRFLDLQKAEAQAREAQIEAGLERVRSRSMAMHKSEELSEVVTLVYEEIKPFGFATAGVELILMDEKNELQQYWLSGDQENKIIECFNIPTFIHPQFQKQWKAWKDQIPRLTLTLEGQEKKAFDQLIFTKTDFKNLSDDVKEFILNHGVDVFSHVIMKYGLLEAVDKSPLSEEKFVILERFAKVFEQTYTRFLDLQKAEAQAREAQIEAALERVRSRTMAMRRSGELADVATVLFQQVKALGVPQWVCGFCIFEIDDKEFTWYPGSRDGDILTPCKVPLTEHPVFIVMNESRKRGDELYVYEIAGEIQAGNYRYMLTIPGLRESLQNLLDAGLSLPEFQINHLANFSHGNLTIITYEHYPEMHDIFKRFAKVFEQTYTRFLDLQKAEAQAREAIKRASVDRVRAEIASMRTTNDLERIQPLIWNELKTLGVPFIRCGVFIMNEEKQEVQTMLSTPEGKAIAILHVPFEFDLTIITNGVLYWRKKKVYTEHWDAAAFTKVWIKLSSLRESSIDSPQTGHPPESLHLHMLPFLQGMLYVGSEAPLNDEQLHLVQNLADAFATAYARYEDFNKLEAAKKQVDNTLNELQTTQKQLIQSEKMASLGELTAGIAHEIQNPLNFVNNFSEVSNELIDEMKDEIKKGNYDEVNGIADDVKQNLEKINHHGKRADAIVKGMLQHSSSGTGKKEPTDINKLADEYLRLAFHGLRAKDKSFNATMKTDFDESIGNINVIPQDIGRVVLNLINNAFYVVDEKSKQNIAGYEPTVEVSTKKDGNMVLVSVKDNGNGIPDSIKEKIFQPFFTTKPTGQGTGLGLSLSYDIVKAHGGELKVETKEGEGSEFIIQLPSIN